MAVYLLLNNPLASRGFHPPSLHCSAHSSCFCPSAVDSPLKALCSWPPLSFIPPQSACTTDLPYPPQDRRGRKTEGCFVWRKITPSEEGAEVQRSLSFKGEVVWCQKRVCLGVRPGVWSQPCLVPTFNTLSPHVPPQDCDYSDSSPALDVPL